MGTREVVISALHTWGKQAKQEMEQLGIETRANYHDPEELVFILQGYLVLKENLKNENLEAYWAENKKTLYVIGEVKKGFQYAQIFVDRLMKDGRPNPLYACLSSAEVSELWDVVPAQIRKDVERQRFYKNMEVRQARWGYMVTVDGLLRVHGMPHPKYFIEPERR